MRGNPGYTHTLSRSPIGEESRGRDPETHERATGGNTGSIGAAGEGRADESYVSRGRGQGCPGMRLRLYRRAIALLPSFLLSLCLSFSRLGGARQVRNTDGLDSFFFRKPRAQG